MRTRSHVDCRTNRRIDSNRFRRDRHAIPACAFAWSRPIYRGLSASLASSARQYFTTINYYSRIDLTPNADTQITATLLPSPRSPTVLLSRLDSPSSLFSLFLALSTYIVYAILLLASPTSARLVPSFRITLYIVDAPVHLGWFCQGRKTLDLRFRLASISDKQFRLFYNLFAIFFKYDRSLGQKMRTLWRAVLSTVLI